MLSGGCWRGSWMALLGICGSSSSSSRRRTRSWPRPSARPARPRTPCSRPGLLLLLPPPRGMRRRRRQQRAERIKQRNGSLWPWRWRRPCAPRQQRCNGRRTPRLKGLLQHAQRGMRKRKRRKMRRSSKKRGSRMSMRRVGRAWRAWRATPVPDLPLLPVWTPWDCGGTWTLPSARCGGSKPRPVSNVRPWAARTRVSKPSLSASLAPRRPAPPRTRTSRSWKTSGSRRGPGTRSLRAWCRRRSRSISRCCCLKVATPAPRRRVAPFPPSRKPLPPGGSTRTRSPPWPPTRPLRRAAGQSSGTRPSTARPRAGRASSKHE
mmetsp:Transcript_2982/g.8552  ORF Transcript_2982/g.8552 Transcript_2982/m.8552 type:complete len:320 (+) Transcript_2982:174-1133(+)